MTILIAQPEDHATVIPSWVIDFQSFRRWAVSDDFPNSGQYAHLDGKLWVDTSMERVAHNRIKTKIAVVLTTLIEQADKGMFLGDRMLLTHELAGLSTEPDGMHISHEALSEGRVTLARGEESLEVLGTPEMVLEVISPTSRQKDCTILPELYHRANIREYWIVDALSAPVTLEILAWQGDGYVSTPKVDGWVESPVFGKSFRLTTTSDRSGFAVYHLETR